MDTKWQRIMASTTMTPGTATCADVPAPVSSRLRGVWSRVACSAPARSVVPAGRTGGVDTGTTPMPHWTRETPWVLWAARSECGAGGPTEPRAWTLSRRCGEDKLLSEEVPTLAEDAQVPLRNHLPTAGSGLVSLGRCTPALREPSLWRGIVVSPPCHSVTRRDRLLPHEFS